MRDFGKTTVVAAMLALGTGGLSGCASNVADPTGGEGSRSEGVDLAPDPFQAELPEESSLRQNVLMRRAIFEGNVLGSGVLEGALNTELTNLGIGALVELEPMTPSTDPDARVAIDQRIDEGDIGVNPSDPAASACPYVEPAPAGSGDLSCRFLLTRAVDTAFIRQAQALHESPVPDEFVAEAPEPLEIEQWYERAVDFAVEHSSIFAADALRESQVCDRELDPVESAFERGVELGREEVESRVAERESSTPRTECMTDRAIVDPARNDAMGAVPVLLDENPLCEGFTPAGRDETARLAQATDEMRAGIERGISEQAAVESARLVRTWRCQPATQNTGGGGGGGGTGDGGGAGGDPLVLDLDGNGVTKQPMGTVTEFGWDGRVLTEWTSAGDAFVVLDRDADGQIDTTELFGDVTLTEDGMLARDGFEALAMYDEDAQGGNGDGAIDASDEIFAALELWDDRDGDGDVDDGELMSFAEAGVASIDVDDHSFTRTDGTRGVAADLVFQYVPMQ